ncbi:Hsp20/alpha crystallin family protein [candidate division KSB1 bacterium]|nr:Hsp20/alpha crystallin family protein [candidate division KSB1 bacterium]NIR70844.1 Hsp20/alpha crystallin family protein [candidate division KSB1 bacterium]NIS24630.1 Hsp20/alpha crystallin family protein [candidate division KSB1 bacterium]NIT71532.1 Hsp20/alpha crystallin family protein [candidate division KSB1 bacterium]NIU25230.1 Hsp20/alpha crystallin family protein [candidate division KSB1 bacterium]
MTQLNSWNPTRDLLGIIDEMNRIVRNVLRNGTEETSLFQGSWTPAVDISEDNDNFYLHVELPGLSKQDVHIRYEDGLLSISGEKKDLNENDGLNFHRLERASGKFERSFRLTNEIIRDQIDAHFENGVLSITLPKAEEAKAKDIEIKVT